MENNRILFVSSDAPEPWNYSCYNPGNLQGAIDIAANHKGKVTIYLYEGVYSVSRMLHFGPEMSNVEFRAISPGKVFFDGGIAIKNWNRSNSDSKDTRGIWTANVSDIISTYGGFKFLYVNGNLKERCRYPGNTVCKGIKTESHLSCNLPETILKSENTEEWELVLFYDWLCRRLKIKNVNSKGIDFIPDKTKNGKDVHFYIENLPHKFLEPGQWKLDSASETLYYMPENDNAPDESDIIAACTSSLLEIQGDYESGKYVENLVFNGIVFRYTGDQSPINSNQAEWERSATVSLTGALECRFENCIFSNISDWGIEFREGCRMNSIHNCRFENTGAGGIMANGSVTPNTAGITGSNRFTGNIIRNGGRVWGGAVGILLRHSAGNQVSDNEICHYRYSGISCGWVWGYGENISRDNVISNNHIHHLNKERLMADLGGIYTLGIQLGTIIYGNVIHDIYGDKISWGIYLDEGSSDILVENNLVFNIASECFHVHYGRDNRVKNNVFAFGEIGICSFTRGTMDKDCKFTPGDKVFICENNIMISSGAPFYFKYILDYEIKEDITCFDTDNNILHHIESEKPIVAGDDYHNVNLTYSKTFTFKEWQENGFDKNSQFIGPSKKVVPQALLEKLDSPRAENLYRKLQASLK